MCTRLRNAKSLDCVGQRTPNLSLQVTDGQHPWRPKEAEGSEFVTSSDKLAVFKKHTKSELRTSLSHKQLTQIHMKKHQKIPSKLFLTNHRYFTVPQ